MLKGEAKKAYQREYMRDYQRQKRGSKQTGLNNPTGSKQGKLDALHQIIQSKVEAHTIRDLSRLGVQPGKSYTKEYQSR